MLPIVDGVALPKRSAVVLFGRFSPRGPVEIEPVQPMEAIDVLDLGCPRELQAGQALEQDRQDDVELQLRQRRTDAEVNAGAEGEVMPRDDRAEGQRGSVNFSGSRLRARIRLTLSPRLNDMPSISAGSSAQRWKMRNTGAQMRSDPRRSAPSSLHP